MFGLVVKYVIHDIIHVSLLSRVYINSFVFHVVVLLKKSNFV
jgi:hypothetical protein